MDDAQARNLERPVRNLGCVGCGRCITWCPVAIDITEEVATINALVAEVPALEGLAPAHLKLIAGCATTSRFEGGTYLFREGDAANAFYAIRPARLRSSTP